jgi:hypothetical protein
MIQKNDDIEHLQSFFQLILGDQFNLLLLSFKPTNQEATTRSSMHKHAWSYGLRIRSRKTFKKVELRWQKIIQHRKHSICKQTKEGKLDKFMPY